MDDVKTGTYFSQVWFTGYNWKITFHDKETGNKVHEVIVDDYTNVLDELRKKENLLYDMEALPKERARVCAIISNMLDNPDECGIYQTTLAYNQFDELIRDIRAETIGYVLGRICDGLDKGEDPRDMEIPTLVENVVYDLW